MNLQLLYSYVLWIYTPSSMFGSFTNLIRTQHHIEFFLLFYNIKQSWYDIVLVRFQFY